MKADIDKTDIINMIRGTSPIYEKIEKFSALGLGSFTGGFVDGWDWKSRCHSVWDSYTEEQLFEFYQELKEYERRFV